MQFDAPFGQLHRKRRGVRSLLRTALNRFVRNEPGIPSASQIAPARVRPARNIAFVLIGNTEREPIDFDPACFGEVKNIFMAIIQKALGADRLEMSVRLSVAFPILNGDRFDPVNCVLQNMFRKNEPSGFRILRICAAQSLHQRK